MLKVVLHSKSVEFSSQIKTQLEKSLPYEVLISFTARDTEDLLSSRSIHALIYDVDQFSLDDIQFLRELRGVGFSVPMLILSQPEQLEPFREQIEKHKMHLLEKPFTENGLCGITRKIVVQRSLHQQQFRRFDTVQEAEIEDLSLGTTFTSKMFNLSKGGAYFEFKEKPAGMGIGDLVRLQLDMKNGRTYSLNARVIWVTRKGMYSGGPGVGMKFVKSSDIYRQLMEKL